MAASRKPSPQQLRCLQNLAEGKRLGHHLTGMAQHGGFEGTRASLVRNGWITADHELTDAGRALTKETAG